MPPNAQGEKPIYANPATQPTTLPSDAEAEQAQPLDPTKADAVRNLRSELHQRAAALWKEAQAQWSTYYGTHRGDLTLGDCTAATAAAKAAEDAAKGADDALNGDPLWKDELDLIVMMGTEIVGGQGANAEFEKQEARLADMVRAERSVQSISRAAGSECKYFRSYKALKAGLGSPGVGNVYHHIVEQREANVFRFGVEAIQNSINAVPVPNEINQAIANYYSEKKAFSGNMVVRQWLNSKSWQEQYDFGKMITDMALAGTPLPP